MMIIFYAIQNESEWNRYEEATEIVNLFSHLLFIIPFIEHLNDCGIRQHSFRKIYLKVKKNVQCK